MKSPKDQKVIQIDITNACTHRCSNCTRHCAHHRKPFFMNLETFKQAVDSLAGYPGMAGIMGGEPTMHPQFEQLIAYYREHIGAREVFEYARQPLSNFTEHAEEHLSFDTGKRRGLWTSLGNKYYEHFELIQDTFSYQCINDHSNPGLHQALLVARKDLGIADADWIPLRDRCWIQNLWSSCITPKGAFFCEVAGALDMLFDGPGGWPIEPGWWKRNPEDFGDQVHWCELCGAALQVPRRRANEERDDISPTLQEKLKAIGSPGIQQSRVHVMDTARYRTDDYQCKPSNEWYLPQEDNSQRVAGTNRSLFPRTVHAVIVAREMKAVAEVIKEALSQFDGVVVALNGDPSGPDCFAGAAVPVVSIPGATRDKLIGVALSRLKSNDWVAVLDDDVILSPGFVDQLRNWILNPGCLYLFSRHGSRGNSRQALIRTGSRDSSHDLKDQAFCSLFNLRAHAIRDLPLDGGAVSSREHWPVSRQIDMHAFLLQPDPLAERRRFGNAMAAHAVSTWQVLQDCRCRTALYGAGHHTRWFLQLLQLQSLPKPCVILDDNPYCYELGGVPVLQPQRADTGTFDTVVISADPGRMSRILKSRCQDLWGQNKNVVELYRQYPEGRFMKVLPVIGEKQGTHA